MPEERSIGSHAPLWRLGSPALALRVGWPFLVLSVALIAIVWFGPAEPGSSFGIGAWVFGCFTAVLLIGATIGYVFLRRISAKVRDYAAANGFDFAIKDRQLTGNWRIAPNATGTLSRDVVTGTVHGRRLTSFLHQSTVSSGKSRGWAATYTVGVRVTILDTGRELPAVALTPRRLSQVDSRTLPTDAPVTIGIPAVEADYHVTTDDPAFAAEFLSAPVRAALRAAPQLAVRIWGSRLIALASPMTAVDGIAASVHVLEIISARLDELAGTPQAPVTSAPPRTRPAYVPPSAARWQLSPFGEPVGEVGRTDVRRGLLGDRPYLTFVHERVIGSGKDRTVHREQVIAVALPARLPNLEVWPENALRNLAPGIAPREDIEIESDEFNRRFQVAAEDRKYAVDVLNPRAVEALLAVPDFEWRIDGSDLIGLWDLDTATPDAVRTRLHALHTVAELIPAHVVADHGWAPADIAATDPDQPLAPVRAMHIVLATLVGLAVLGAGVPIAFAITDDKPGAWAGGIVVVVVIAAVAVMLTVVFGRVVDDVRRKKNAY